MGNDPSHIYDTLWADARERLAIGTYEPDRYLSSASDSRRGLTVLARLAKPVVSEICRFLCLCAEREPDQYYYRSDDIHMTVLSIMNCSEGFDLAEVNTGDYIRVIRESLRDKEGFRVRFSGITASPSCVMIQGFPESGALEGIREALREGVKSSGLPHTIDGRYRLEAAHSTVVRFSKPLRDPQAFASFLAENRRREFGISTVGALEFVFNDWYVRRENTKGLADFELRASPCLRG